MQQKQTTVLFAMCLLAGCPAPEAQPLNDAQIQDTQVGDSTRNDAQPSDAQRSDAAQGCAPEGTYNVVWTRTAGPAACPVPQTLITILPNGLESGQAQSCTGACTSANCSIAPISSTACGSSIRYSEQCGSLGAWRTITASFAFTGNTAQFEIRDTNQILDDSGDASIRDAGLDDAGLGRAECAFTGVGTRR